jgi:hypothetical protein
VDKLPPSRRAFIKGLALALPAIGFRPRTALATNGTELSFYVAGARFHPLRRALVIGDPITIVEGVFRGERCYAIYSHQGEQIGYVPRRLVSVVQEFRTTKGQVLSVDNYAVPWQRYCVGLVDQSRFIF